VCSLIIDNSLEMVESKPELVERMQLVGCMQVVENSLVEPVDIHSVNKRLQDMTGESKLDYKLSEPGKTDCRIVVCSLVVYTPVAVSK